MSTMESPVTLSQASSCHLIAISSIQRRMPADLFLPAEATNIGKLLLKQIRPENSSTHRLLPASTSSDTEFVRASHHPPKSMVHTRHSSRSQPTVDPQARLSASYIRKHKQCFRSHYLRPRCSRLQYYRVQADRQTLTKSSLQSSVPKTSVPEVLSDRCNAHAAFVLLPLFSSNDTCQELLFFKASNLGSPGLGIINSSFEWASPILIRPRLLPQLIL